MLKCVDQFHSDIAQLKAHFIAYQMHFFILNVLNLLIQSEKKNS